MYSNFFKKLYSLTLPAFTRDAGVLYKLKPLSKIM